MLMFYRNLVFLWKLVSNMQLATTLTVFYLHTILVSPGVIRLRSAHHSDKSYLYCHSKVLDAQRRCFGVAANTPIGDQLSKARFEVQIIHPPDRIPQPLRRTVLANLGSTCKPANRRVFSLVVLKNERVISFSQVMFKVDSPTVKSEDLAACYHSEVKAVGGDYCGLRGLQNKNMYYIYGFVELKGRNGFHQHHQRICTLPVGRRPEGIHEFLVTTDEGKSNECPGLALLRLYPTGNLIFVEMVRGYGIVKRLSLEGIRFQLASPGAGGGVAGGAAIGTTCEDGARLTLGRNVLGQRPVLRTLPGGPDDAHPFSPVQVLQQESLCLLSGQVFKQNHEVKKQPLPAHFGHGGGYEHLTAAGIWENGDLIGILPRGMRPAVTHSFAVPAGRAPSWPNLNSGGDGVTRVFGFGAAPAFGGGHGFGAAAPFQPPRAFQFGGHPGGGPFG